MMCARRRNPEDKLPHILAAETEARRLRADTVRRPEDRIPLKLHEARAVDELGTPQLAEAFLRYLNNERGRTFEERCLQMVLTDLQRTDRPLWAVMEEHYFYRRSEAEIAQSLHVRQQTVNRILCMALVRVRTAYVQFFAEVAHE